MMMIATMQAAKRTTDEPNEVDARLYQSIPSQAGHVPHPEYLRAGTEKTLFGPDAAAVLVPQWNPSPELADGQDEVQPPQARRNLSRQDEVTLFMRYNCARHHLAELMGKQVRRFVASRVPRILAWYRRVCENRAALTQANMPLVVAMAKRTRANSVEFGELVSEGNMALLRAVDKFDISRGFRFSTYACSAIMKSFSRLAIATGTYHQRFGTTSEPEMERCDGMDRRHADQHALAIEDLQRVLSLNRGALTDIEQTVLGARFAVSGHSRTHTLQEVSGLVSLSKERVRQVQNVALTKLRLALRLNFSPAPMRPGETVGTFEGYTTSTRGQPGLEAIAAGELATG